MKPGIEIRKPGIETRHLNIKYGVNGEASQKLVCRYPDPRETMSFPNGRDMKQYPILVVSSPVQKKAECMETAGLILDNARGTTVDKEMCALQIECGECPRGFTPETVKELR